MTHQSGNVEYDFGPEYYLPRERWEGDADERAKLSDIPEAADIVTAVMVVGYETLRGHGIAPSGVLLSFANDLEVYAVSRHIKRRDDAIEYFTDRSESRPHIRAFLEDAFDMIEDAHQRGVETQAILALLRERASDIMTLTIRQANQDSTNDLGRFTEHVWQAALEDQAKN